MVDHRTLKEGGDRYVSDAIWIAITVLLGVTQALQVALLGAMNRARGPSEAAYLSILGSIAGLSLALTVRGLLGSRPVLPAPFDQPVTTGAVAIATGTLRVVVVRGLPGGYALTGVLAVPYLLAASYLAPRIGVGLFLAALITGQLGGGMMLDHLGAFGAAMRPIDPVRVLGIGVLVAGVVLVRGFR
jgi:transporter family-2 protein